MHGLCTALGSKVRALTPHIVQEIGDMLANNLSLDEEESVQAELVALQREAVRYRGSFVGVN